VRLFNPWDGTAEVSFELSAFWCIWTKNGFQKDAQAKILGPPTEVSERNVMGCSLQEVKWWGSLLMPGWISELLVVLPLLIVDINELLRGKKMAFLPIISVSLPLLLLDNDRKFLLPFLYATVNLCCNSKWIMGDLIYELRRTFPEELQSETWNPTVRKVSMQHLANLICIYSWVWKLQLRLWEGFRSLHFCYMWSVFISDLVLTLVLGPQSGCQYCANFFLTSFFFPDSSSICFFSHGLL